MKSSIFICIMLLSSVLVLGQVPQKFRYQAVVRNVSGAVLSNQSVSLQISLLKDSLNGPSVYVERHSTSTNNFGVAAVDVGGGAMVTGSFSGIKWNSGEYFIKIEIDPLGGTTYTEMSRTQLLSVPYSLYSENGIMAYGNVWDDGTIMSGSGNFTITRIGTGRYYLFLDPPMTFSATTIVISGSLRAPGFFVWEDAGGDIVIRTLNQAGMDEDIPFNFMLLKP